MADNEVLQQKKNEQLSKAIRVGSTHSASELRRMDRGLYDIQAIERDNADIASILESSTLELEDTERARLSAIEGRNLSTLLILQEKTLGDSEKMEDVKKAVSAIEVALSRTRQADAPFTPAEVEDILIMYSRAILACNTYLALKHPGYSKGRKRYDQVKINMIRLHEEAEAFMNAKELLATGVLNGQVLTAHELMVQAKVYDLGNGTGVPEGPVPARAGFDERTLEPLGLETNLIYSALSGKETPSNLIMRLSRSKDKNEKKLAGDLPAIFANIRSSLNDFREGKVAAKFFVVGNSLLSVSQNVYGQLTLSIGKNHIPLERGTGLLADMLASDIAKNRKVYGMQAGDEIAREIVDHIEVNGLNTGKRQIMTDYLVNKTGSPASTFSNFYTNSLAMMIKALLNGKNVYIVKLGKEIDVPLTANDVVFTEEESRMINTAEVKELMSDRVSREKREKIREQVVLQKKEEKAEEPEVKRKEGRSEQKQEREWDKRETKIKNLLGDVVFSYETWDADNQVLLPGVRLQTMLMKNHEAVAELVADLYRRNGDKRAVINGIVDQLPLFALQDEEQIMELKSALTETLNRITDTINDKISKSAFFAFGEALENLEAMEQEEQLKKIKREYEAAKRAKENKESLKKGNSFTNFFRRIGQYSVNAAVAVKNKAVDLKDDSVKNVRFFKTTAILRHLTDPKALIEGNAAFKIPAIKDIIKDTAMDTFINLEQDIDQSVEAAAGTIQERVSQYAGELFHPVEQAEEPLPNPFEEGIGEAEVKRRKSERIRIGNERLIQRTKDSITSGESGQGLFIKNVFENYFKDVPTIDKRSMLASMIRNSRPVGRLLDENDPAIDPAADNLSENVRLKRAEEKNKRHEHNEKLKTAAMAGYIGGLLKGAGPLFQKMMQGLPAEGLPEELKGAVEDMKSRLAPIPDEVVEARLNSIVENSHKQIKKIQVIKSLGAASVGQTFLCTLTRADGTEEECAVKLLKPDVRNRMMREKKIMMECARKTDIIGRQKDNEKRTANGLPALPELKAKEKGGMQATYEGQLQRIEEELDLTIEAKNVELGRVYDNVRNEKEKNAVSVKLNSLVSPSTNSMVLEKAAGETLDSLLKRIGEETRRLKDLYKREKYITDDMPEEKKAEFRQRATLAPYYTSLTTIRNETGIEMYSKQYEELDPVAIQEKLCGLLAELKKKKAYLEAFAYKWTKEGVFEDGFYHGDPHDGNIMISDEKLTVIDFGNCTKLTEEQQVHITRMMAAASIGDIKTFRHGFHQLLKPEFETLYQEKRTELTRRFAEIFALGDRRSSGARIAVALLEAQKLGLEIPSAVFNFSQGQMRLQNALDNMNRQIRETEEAAAFFTEVEDEHNIFDFTDVKRKHDVGIDPTLHTISQSYTMDLMCFTDRKEDLKPFLVDYAGSMKEMFFGQFSEAGTRFDRAIESFREVAQTVRFTPYDPDNPQVVNQLSQGLMSAVRENVAQGLKYMCDPDLMTDIYNYVLKSYKTQSPDDQQIEALVARLVEQKNIAEGIHRAYDAMEKKREKILRDHDNKWKPDSQEMAEFDVLRDRFLDVFFPLHIKVSLLHGSFLDSFERITDPDPLKREVLGLNMSRYFRQHPEGREEFMLAYDAFIGAQNSGLRKSNPDEYRKKSQELASAYRKIMAIRIREKQNVFDAAVKKQNADFLDIMSLVVDEELSKMISRMGYMDSLIFSWKFKKQKKSEEALQDDNNDIIGGGNQG